MKIYTHEESKRFLKGLPFAKSFLIKKEKELEKIKKFPVVLKIISKQALHKTEIGGIKIAYKKEDLKKSFEKFFKISKKRKIKLEGILVQEFIKGKELIIGIKKDPTFGHVIMFGLGGILVELLKDVSFRVCPVTEEDANSMINEIKFKNLIFGFRGEKPINVKQLKQILVKISKVPLKHPKIEELDINPLMANENECKIVDVRIITK